MQRTEFVLICTIIPRLREFLRTDFADLVLLAY